MALPTTQPRRAVVVLSGSMLLATLGAIALWLWRGPFLGGLLALMWVMALLVPAAVLAQRPMLE